MLQKYLEDLEARINPDVEEDLFKQWTDFWSERTSTPLFIPRRRAAAPSKLEWPKIKINDAILDPSFETMLLAQLGAVNTALADGNGLHLAIRANYGTGILPSLFGVGIFMMERELDTLPGTLAVAGGGEAIKKLIAAGIPDLNGGQGEAVFGCTRYFQKMLADYPKLSRYCRIYHPDLQGVFDVCEVVWGSEVFFAIYDAPDLVKAFMQLVTDTYIAFIERWFELVPPAEDYNIHYGWVHRGKIRLSLDSCMNLSPATYEEFVKPYDAQLLARFGGVVHSCGKVDHFTPLLCGLAGYHGFHLSQPEYNDMETVYRSTIDRGVKVLSLRNQTAQQALDAGRDLRRSVMGEALL